MKFFWLVVSVALLGGLPAVAQQSPRSVSVQGSGATSARPDTAIVRAGVETRAPSPEIALLGNTAAMTKIFEILRGHGIVERDVTTTVFDVSPIYGRPDAQNNVQTIQAYQVSNQVAARLRNIDRVGPLLTELVEAGANRLRGVSFEIANPEPLQAEARRAAMQDARKRAELYAAAAGLKLGRVLSITETDAPVAPMPRQMRAMGEAVPIAPGEQTVSATVTVVYEIE
jgi:uncharacterized protein YggE